MPNNRSTRSHLQVEVIIICPDVDVLRLLNNRVFFSFQHSTLTPLYPPASRGKGKSNPQCLMNRATTLSRTTCSFLLFVIFFLSNLRNCAFNIVIDFFFADTPILFVDAVHQLQKFLPVFRCHQLSERNHDAITFNCHILALFRAAVPISGFGK